MKVTFDKIIWAVRALVYKPFFKKLGLPSYIGQPNYLEGICRISLGSRVRVFPGIRMEALRNGAITIEDNVYMGVNVHMTSEGSELRIGAGTAIMSNVCITNIDHNYESVGVPVLEQGYTLRETRIGKNCFIGHNAVIQAGVILGDNCVVGACAVVMRGKYDSCSVICGVPAKILKKFDANENTWRRVNAYSV